MLVIVLVVLMWFGSVWFWGINKSRDDYYIDMTKSMANFTLPPESCFSEKVGPKPRSTSF